MFDMSGDETVQSIVENHFSGIFPFIPIPCQDCGRQLDGQKSFQLMNQPDFLPICINRGRPLGDQISIHDEHHFDLICCSTHVGSVYSGHYS